jgi:glycosyltransferase involved in cell wall biosynthesis
MLAERESMSEELIELLGSLAGDDAGLAQDLLEANSFFDAATYVTALGLDDSGAALRHYLTKGWQLGLEPNPNFEGSFLYPYFHSIGLDGPPALTYAVLRLAGWPVLAKQAEAQATARTIEDSGFFDRAFYEAQVGPLDKELDPAIHYLMLGERLGYSPGKKFDPKYYSERYADVAFAKPAICYLYHYLKHGRPERRSLLSVASTLRYDLSKLDPKRQTILLIAHESSRTGAPILVLNLARRLGQIYNVVLLALEDGDLVEELRSSCSALIGPLSRASWHEAEARPLARSIFAHYDISYVIANSIEARPFVPAFADHFVPVVMLMHEFASYTRPKATMKRALDWSSEIVFSTTLTADSARAVHPALAGRDLIVMPQGKCDLPSSKPALSRSAELNAFIRAAKEASAFVVLGCGSVHIRKGTDLFFAAAAAISALNPKAKLLFLWIGHGYAPESDTAFSCYLAEQINRSHLSDKVAIISAVDDLDAAYDAADVLFLSSRLDPMPNVAIDAALLGKPVICFEGASGFAEMLLKDPTTRDLVVPYLDSHAAAEVMLDLASDQTRRNRVATAIKGIAESNFDMERYVARIDELGRKAMLDLAPRRADHATILDDDLFDELIYAPDASFCATRDDHVRTFVNGWAAVGTTRSAATNPYFRRPFPGFHPQIYAEVNFPAGEQRKINPLAHYIRTGRPKGPWLCRVLSPSAHPPQSPAKRERAILHAHFYYPELAADLVQKLGANLRNCDLLVTTDSDDKAADLETTLRDYALGDVRIEVVPNRGRDFGPLLGLGSELLGKYDVVGHVHGKRSVSTDETMGNSWREFLWQHLIGDVYPMADFILDHFSREKDLGLVFANDPHLPDWDGNRTIAEDVVHRMGIDEPLPNFFEFPVGTMFWARPEALKPLFDLGLKWEDYPEEPVPYDGTILHALERLLPFAAKRAGFGFAVTHVAGVTW